MNPESPPNSGANEVALPALVLPGWAIYKDKKALVRSIGVVWVPYQWKVEVMAVADGFAMVRRKGGMMPFVVKAEKLAQKQGEGMSGPEPHLMDALAKIRKVLANALPEDRERYLEHAINLGQNTPAHPPR